LQKHEKKGNFSAALIFSLQPSRAEAKGSDQAKRKLIILRTRKKEKITNFYKVSE